MRAPCRIGTAVRRLFPLSTDRLYLNTGGLGPASQPVLNAMQEQNVKAATIGEHYHSRLKAVHGTAARVFGVDEDEVAFVRNASEGNSVIAAGMRLESGDEVIFDSHAHPGGFSPWMNRQKLDGVKVRVFEPSSESPEANLDRIFSLVNERTRVIQVSHITATTGLLFDIAAIAAQARKRGIWFHVDGAQSAGMIPLDLRVLQCDSYATSGHKWLNGFIETGLLYIARERIDAIDCSHLGSYSSEEYDVPDSFVYVPTVQRHEYGTHNAAPVMGLGVAFEFQERIGRERIAAHGKQLAKETQARIEILDGIEILTPQRDDMRGSILTFRFPGRDSRAIYTALWKRGVRSRIVTEEGLNAVRVSWHVYHQIGDVESFVQGLKSVI